MLGRSPQGYILFCLIKDSVVNEGGREGRKGGETEGVCFEFGVQLGLTPSLGVHLVLLPGRNGAAGEISAWTLIPEQT